MSRGADQNRLHPPNGFSGLACASQSALGDGERKQRMGHEAHWDCGGDADQGGGRGRNEKTKDHPARENTSSQDELCL
jgi:hypothetical protein